jgi:hypothetical protein
MVTVLVYPLGIDIDLIAPFTHKYDDRPTEVIGDELRAVGMPAYADGNPVVEPLGMRDGCRAKQKHNGNTKDQT